MCSFPQNSGKLLLFYYNVVYIESQQQWRWSHMYLIWIVFNLDLTRIIIKLFIGLALYLMIFFSVTCTCLLSTRAWVLCRFRNTLYCTRVCKIKIKIKTFSTLIAWGISLKFDQQMNPCCLPRIYHILYMYEHILLVSIIVYINIAVQNA